MQDKTSQLSEKISMALIKIIEAIDAENKHEARCLFEEAFNFICVESGFKVKALIKEGIEKTFALIYIIKPQDNKEKVSLALILLSLILGIHKLSLSDSHDNSIGLALLKVSNDTLNQISEKREEELSLEEKNDSTWY